MRLQQRRPPLIEGRELTGQQRGVLEQQGNDESSQFFAQVVSLPRLAALQASNGQLDLHPGLPGVVYRRFKNTGGLA